MSVGSAAWCLGTEGAVASAAAGTAKSVLKALAASGKVVKLTELFLQIDGVSATEKPWLVEVCQSTEAGAGTFTSITPRRVSGQAAATAGVTGGKAATAEPTVLSVIKELTLDPYKGSLLYQVPLGREPETDAGKALVIRVTVPTGGATGSIRGYIEIEE